MERQSTGSAGEPALFLHAGAQLKQERAGSQVDPPESIGARVTLEALLADPILVELDADHLPEQPVDLVMPPCGEVEVRVRDLDGREVDPEISVALGADDGRIWKDDHLTAIGWSSRLGEDLLPSLVQQSRCESGRVDFEHVGLGLDLVAIARRNTASGSFGARFRGPTRPGERTTVTIVLGTKGLNLAGTLVDEAGAELGDRDVSFRLYALPGPDSFVPERHRVGYFYPDDAEVEGPVLPYRGRVKTDARGRFALDFELEDSWGGHPVLVISTLDAPGELRTASIDLESSWNAGSHDLGRIVLSEAPVLASGRVVSRDGEVVPGARVSLNDVGFRYPDATTRTDDTGRFTFLGLTPLQRVTLDADAKGHESVAYLDVAPGTTDLVLCLASTGTLEGSILLPRSTAPSAVTVQCDAFWIRGRDDGSFSFELPPGRHSLVIWSNDLMRVLARRDDVLVEHGGTTRLDPIDLRHLR